MGRRKKSNQRIQKLELKVRAFSYNIHKGFNAGQRKFTLSKIRTALRSVHPDIVFLQEVQGEHKINSQKIKEWPLQSQFEYLAHELWPHYAYGKNAVYDHGHHGNAILSKHPFVFSENIDISTNSFEQRGLLHSIVQIPGNCRPLHVICVHLGLLEAERTEQVIRLCKRIESHVPHHEPLIIGGDFNDWRQKVSSILKSRLEVQEAFQTLFGSHVRTFPTWLPAFKLDRIYYRGLTVRRAECLTARPWRHLSDHAALVAELVL